MLDKFRNAKLIVYENDDESSSQSQIFLSDAKWNKSIKFGYYDEGFRLSLDALSYDSPFFAVQGKGLDLGSGCVLSDGESEYHLFSSYVDTIDLTEGVLITDFLKFEDICEIHSGSLKNIKCISKKYTKKREKLLSELEKETGGKYAFDISKVDSSRPPGFAGKIADIINKKSTRKLEQMSVIGALTLLSTCANRFRLGHNGVKLYFSSICIAPSASGKESFQDAIYKITEKININDFGIVPKLMVDKVIPNIQSAKDITTSIIERDGTSLFLIDEGHSIMKQMLSTESHSTGMESDLLKLITKTGRINNPGLWIRQAISSTSESINGIKKKLKSKDIEYEEEHQLRQELHVQKSILDLYKNGIVNPKLNIVMTSTPKNFAKYINEQNIESGFLGRSFLAYMDDMDISPINDFVCTNDKTFDNIAATLQGLITHTAQIQASPEAKVLFKKVKDWYDQQQFRCHASLGAIYRRGYEAVLRIASILAHGESRNITAEQVRWAYRFFEDNVSRLKGRYLENQTKEGERNFDMLLHEIQTQIQDKPEGVSFGIVLQNVYRKTKIKQAYKKEEVEKHIDILAKKEEKIKYIKNTKKLVFIQ